MNNLNSGVFLIGDFMMRESIGSGASGNVRVADNLNLSADTNMPKQVAIKIIELKSRDTPPSIDNDIMREATLLQDINHENVVKGRGLFIYNSKHYLVMDYYPTHLWEFFESNPLLLKPLLKQLLAGIAHCHQLGVIHRDIKFANILVDTSVPLVKIADFGSARSCVDTVLTPRRGTYEYMAPELLLLSKENKYSFGVDLWSVGCMFGEMITGDKLFPGGSSVSAVLNHMFSKLGIPSDDVFPPDVYPLPILESYKDEREEFLQSLRSIDPSGTGIDLLLKLLEYDPCKRITAVDALEHAYFRD